MTKTIALLAGGYSGEYDISIQSAATIKKHLNAKNYRVFTIRITPENWIYTGPSGEETAINKTDFTLPLPDEVIHFDAVFLAIHGSPGEDGKLQGYLDMLRIPYTGCGVVTSALTFNKSFCNKVVAAFNLVKVSKSVHLFHHIPYDIDKIYKGLRFPVFVKPAEGGSSLGISKVKEQMEMEGAIQLAFETDHQVLIEEFVKGRELTCGVFKAGDQLTPLPITEIKSSKDFFDYEAKYTAGMAEEITPAEVEEDIAERVQETATLLYLKLNCKGIVRFDFILEEASGDLYFLEVNTMPGQSPGSIVPKQLKAAGLEAGAVYGMLIEECLASFS